MADTESRGMSVPEPAQLTFDVGGDAPNVASLKLSAAFALGTELAKGQLVAIRIIDQDGQMLVESEARIVAVGFVDHYDEYGSVAFVERSHRAKVH